MVRHPYDKGPKRDPSLENYPCGFKGPGMYGVRFRNLGLEASGLAGLRIREVPCGLQGRYGA